MKNICGVVIYLDLKTKKPQNGAGWGSNWKAVSCENQSIINLAKIKIAYNSRSLII